MLKKYNLNLVEKIFWMTVLTSVLFVNISVEPIIKGKNVIYIIMFICALLWIIFYRMFAGLDIVRGKSRKRFNMLSIALIAVFMFMIILRKQASFIYALPLAIALLLAILLIYQPEGPIAIIVVLSAFLLGEGFWRIRFSGSSKVNFATQFFNLYYLTVLIILVYYLYRREAGFYNKLKEANEKLARTVLEVTHSQEELTAAHEKLKTLDTLKTDFVASVSHELFTPLTSIKNAADLLKRHKNGILCNDKDVNELVELIQANGTRQEKLLKQLLELSKIELVGRHACRTFMDLSLILKNIVNSLKPQAENKNIKFTINTPETLNIWGSAEQLQTVFTNIIENAVKYSPKNEAVEVICSDEGDNIRVLISDRGPGVPENKKTFIFERFARILYTDEPIKEGIGLGLAIARELLDIHRGQISVEKRVGAGSNFIVIIPKDLREGNKV